MKERFLDVIKWGLILIIAGVVFYVVCPKYDFKGPTGVIIQRCNKITGVVDTLIFDGKKWETLKNASEKVKSKG